MTKKVFKTVKLSEEGFNYLTFLADVLNTKKSSLLTRILKEMFDITSEFKEAGIFFDVRSNQLLITVFGKSSIVSGSFSMPTEASDETVDSAIKQRIEEVINNE